MASVQEPLRRDPFANESRDYSPSMSKSIPILPSASPAGGGDPMEVSQSQSTSMGPPATNGGDKGEQHHQPQQNSDPAQQSANGAPVSAAAAAQQPKVVQTAFIHKLYNMLEDQSIQHLISWASTNESFVMSPSTEFSKVLAQYFKHTNISSFVRQLNMYGFHKVSDVFHTGSPDSPLWEFKHGGGNFKRGDLVGLREIKRRASRHTLIHRDSFSTAPKLPTAQPIGPGPGPAPAPAPGPPMEPMADPVEARLNLLEWNIQDVHARLSRTEEAYAHVSSKYQTLLEGLTRCHHWSNEISSHLLTVVPDPDNPVHRDVFAMRQDIRQHMDALRTMDEPSPQESLFAHRQSFFQPPTSNMDQAMPMSSRQRAFDESRRGSLQALPRPPGIRVPVPPYLQASPRRFGSIGGPGSGSYSPSRPTYANPPPPPLPLTQQQQHPLSQMTSPPSNLPRRHTSADIRLEGWEGGQPPSQQYGHGSPYASGQSSSAWPSSPRVAPQAGDQHIRDQLAQYELPRVINNTSSRQQSPGPHEHQPPAFTNSFAPSYANTNDAGWQLPGARFPFKGLDNPSRRSSMASNVHSLLNPADTAEREGEDEGGGPDERKRKRLL